MWKLQHNYLCKSISIFQKFKRRSHYMLLIKLCSNHCLYTFCTQITTKAKNRQITLWHLLLAHKMKTFIKCFPRCLNCTRKLIGSGIRPTSGCRTRFRCQNSFTPRWYSTFKRGDGNVSSAKPRKINDHHSEIYGLLEQCLQPWSSRRKGRMEWGRARKVMRSSVRNLPDSVILQEFPKFPEAI